MDPTHVLALFLPEGVLDHFDITNGAVQGETLVLTLVEKNQPPPHPGTLTFKGYQDMDVSDFPIRGKRGVLHVRRRYWQKEDGTTVMNAHALTFPGTKLEKTFADFLKARSGS
jgi:hypothetical protein